jgi:hypothetical protein
MFLIVSSIQQFMPRVTLYRPVVRCIDRECLWKVLDVFRDAKRIDMYVQIVYTIATT